MPPTETMMTTEAANPTEGQTASETATTTATAADTGGQQQQVTEIQTAEGQTAEGGEAKSEQEKPEGAPEKYEFKAAEGQTFSPQVIAKFSEVAKKLNLTQDAAQEVLSEMSPIIQAQQAEVLNSASEGWAESAKVDKEFGGQALTENLSVAKQALEAFASPELRTLLQESGLGNHPEIIRTFYRVGKAISEDKFVGGQSSKANSSDARSIYAASNMNP